MALKEIVTGAHKDLLGETKAQALLYSMIWLGCSTLVLYDETLSQPGKYITSGMIGTAGLLTAYRAIKPKSEEQSWQEGLDRYKQWLNED